MKFCLVLIWVLGGFWLLNAQVLNIEKERLSKQEDKSWKTKLSASLSLYNRSSGENNPIKKTEFEIDYSSIYQPKEHAYILIAEIDFESLNGEGLMEFGFVHGRINWFRDKKLSYETFGQISYDGARGLQVRTLAGSGLRIEIHNNETWELYFAPGLMYEYEKWQNPYNEDKATSKMLKSSNYWSAKWQINDYLDLSNVLYYQTGVHQDQLRNRFSNWLVLNTKISNTFGFKNSLVLNYEDKPIVPIVKFVYILKAGISLNF